MRFLSLLLMFALIQGLLAKPFGISDMEDDDDSTSVKESDNTDEEENPTNRDQVFSDTENVESDSLKQTEDEQRYPIMTATLSRKMLRFPNGNTYCEGMKVFYSDENRIYRRAKVVRMTGTSIVLKLENGRRVSVSTRNINSITPDKVPSSCQLSNRVKVLTVDGKTVLPGEIIDVYFYVAIDGKKYPTWVPTSQIRQINTECGMASEIRGPLIRNKKLLIHEQTCDQWFAADLIKRVNRRKIKYRRTEYPHPKGFVTNVGNRIIRSVYVNPGSVYPGNRVLADISDKAISFKSATVIKVGYLTKITLPNGRSTKYLMSAPELRLRPDQPWYIKDKTEVTEDEGIDDLRKGYKITIILEHTRLPSMVLDVKRIKRKKYAYKIRIDFDKTSGNIIPKEPQPNSFGYTHRPTDTYYVRSKLKKVDLKRKILESIIEPGYPVRKGFLKLFYDQDPNPFVPDEVPNPDNLFQTLRVIARIPSLKGKQLYPGNIVQIDRKKKKCLVNFIIEGREWVPFKDIRVLPQQDETVVEKMITTIIKRKYIWFKIKGKKYQGRITNIGKRLQYIIIIVVVRKKAPTDCTKLVDEADKYLKSLATGDRLWAKVGCDYFRGTVVRRMPTLRRRNSYNRLKIYFKLFGSRLTHKLHRGPMKVTIRRRNYYGFVRRVSLKGKGFWMTMRARAHRIPRGLRERMSEIQKEMQRRLSRLWQKGTHIWAKIRGKWYPSLRKYRYRPNMKTVVRFKIKRGNLRKGSRISAKMAKMCVRGKIYNVQKNYASALFPTPTLVVKAALRGQKLNIEKETLKENKDAPIAPASYCRITKKGVLFRRIFQKGGTAIIEAAGHGTVYYRCLILRIARSKVTCRIIYPGISGKSPDPVSINRRIALVADVPPVKRFVIPQAVVLVELPTKNGIRGRFIRGTLKSRYLVKKRRRGRTILVRMYSVKFDHPQRDYINGKRRKSRILTNISLNRLRLISIQYVLKQYRQIFHGRTTISSLIFANLILKQHFGSPLKKYKPNERFRFIVGTRVQRYRIKFRKRRVGRRSSRKHGRRTRTQRRAAMRSRMLRRRQARQRAMLSRIRRRRKRVSRMRTLRGVRPIRFRGTNRRPKGSRKAVVMKNSLRRKKGGNVLSMVNPFSERRRLSQYKVLQTSPRRNGRRRAGRREASRRASSRRVSERKRSRSLSWRSRRGGRGTLERSPRTRRVRNSYRKRYGR